MKNLLSIIVLLFGVVAINAQVRKEPFVELFTFDKIKHTFEETFGIPIDIRTSMIYD